MQKMIKNKQIIKLNTDKYVEMYKKCQFLRGGVDFDANSDIIGLCFEVNQPPLFDLENHNKNKKGTRKGELK